MTDATHPAAEPAQPAQRWLARLAFVTAAAAFALPLVVAGLAGSIVLVLVGVGGVGVSLAALWSALTHRRVMRWLSAALALAAPVIAAAIYIRAELLWVVVVSALLWLSALAAGRGALAGTATGVAVEYETPPPRHPFLIMNPRSGGGKVEKFRLAERARAVGAEVALLEGPATIDVAELARQAVRDGADLLGVAGGDGTQALVAGIAAEYQIPFMVISAGTRNHFALDLGLDRQDPATCLDALTDGVELRVDLGEIGGRTFVNNASFGAYAAVVQSPAYRHDKTRTTLDLLPDMLTQHREPVLRLSVADKALIGPQAVLVSNNPYAEDDVVGMGRRAHLDRGVLGVLAVTVGGAGDAVRLIRGLRSKALTVLTADKAVVEADAPSIPVGIDGEAVILPTPVTCTIRSAALRVRVPRHRPGTPGPRRRVDWVALRHLALSTAFTGRR